MFEVGFSEIILIFGIALLVLGPEKLPKLAADIGRWAGRARAMARQLRSQLEQEVQHFESIQDLEARSTPAQRAPEPAAPMIHRPAPAPEAASAPATPVTTTPAAEPTPVTVATPEPAPESVAATAAPTSPETSPPTAAADERKPAASAG